MSGPLVLFSVRVGEWMKDADVMALDGDEMLSVGDERAKGDCEVLWEASERAAAGAAPAIRRYAHAMAPCICAWESCA